MTRNGTYAYAITDYDANTYAYAITDCDGYSHTKSYTITNRDSYAFPDARNNPGARHVPATQPGTVGHGF